MSDAKEKAKKAAARVQATDLAMAKHDAVVKSFIADALLVLLEQDQSITLDALVEQLHRQAGPAPKSLVLERLMLAEQLLRAAQPKRP